VWKRSVEHERRRAVKDTMMLLGTLTLYGLAFAAGYFDFDLAVRQWRRGKK
jgi:hypothetical protein